MTSMQSPTTLPSAIVHSPQWDPATIYGIVFGITTIVLGIPGAWVGIHAALQKRSRAKAFEASATVGE
jgi:hypothetical protein